MGLCLALWLAAGISTVATAAAPSLTAHAVFTKSSYVSGQPVSVKLHVHNSGTTDAVGISLQADYGGAALVADRHGVGKFNGPVTIPAGRTIVASVSGNLGSLTAGKVTFSGDLFDRHGNGVAHFSASAPVTARTATLRGQVFGDSDADGHADAGEGVSGVKVRLFYRYGRNRYSAVTGRNGRFHLVVPTAQYYLESRGKGWTVVPRLAGVHPGGSAVSLRAVRPLGKRFTASMRFTKTRYRPGDTAHIDVTLTNGGPARLRGITAACGRAGDPNELRGTGRGWGALAAQGRGVILQAHSKRTFHVSAIVPAAAQRLGQVVAACDFGYPAVDRGYRPTAYDAAKVPGQFGAVVGDVEYYLHGHSGKMAGLKNVRMVLVDPTTCPVFARSVRTDRNGHFRMSHVPAGESYKMYVFPPRGWHARGANPTNTFVAGKDTNRFGFYVKRGTGHTPTVPKKCS